MTSWPNIPKGMRRGMKAPARRPGFTGASSVPRPPRCKYPGCYLVYTPGYYKEHARDYHGDSLGKLRSWEA